MALFVSTCMGKPEKAALTRAFVTPKSPEKKPLTRGFVKALVGGHFWPTNSLGKQYGPVGVARTRESETAESRRKRKVSPDGYFDQESLIQSKCTTTHQCCVTVHFPKMP